MKFQLLKREKIETLKCLKGRCSGLLHLLRRRIQDLTFSHPLISLAAEANFDLLGLFLVRSSWQMNGIRLQY